MIIIKIHDISKNGRVIATLLVYLSGSGNPSDNHIITAVSIGGYWIGYIPNKVDAVERMEDIIV